MGYWRGPSGLLVVMLCATTAAADRKVEAQQLFDEGKRLMAEQRFGDACPKFAASHALAPSASTLMNLGACQEADKKLATAWGTFQEAAALASRTDAPLFEPSRQRALALEPRLSSLQVDVPASSRVEGLEIMRNGVALMEAQWGSRIFVDGGEYEIVARAPGTVAWTAKISVATELDRRSVEIPRLVADAAATNEPGQGTPREEAAVPTVFVSSKAPALTMRRKVAIGLGVGGILGVATGSLLAAKAFDDQAASDAICPMTTCNSQEGLQLNKDARSTGLKATILLSASGVALGASVFLWVTGKSPARGEGVSVIPVASPDGAGLVVRGSL